MFATSRREEKEKEGKKELFSGEVWSCYFFFFFVIIAVLLLLLLMPCSGPFFSPSFFLLQSRVPFLLRFRSKPCGEKKKEKSSAVAAAAPVMMALEVEEKTCKHIEQAQKKEKKYQSEAWISFNFERRLTEEEGKES